MHQDNYFVTLSVPLCQTKQALELYQCASTIAKIYTFFENGGEFHSMVSKFAQVFSALPVCYVFSSFSDLSHGHMSFSIKQVWQTVISFFVNNFNFSKESIITRDCIISPPSPPLLYWAPMSTKLNVCLRGCFGLGFFFSPPALHFFGIVHVPSTVLAASC